MTDIATLGIAVDTRQTTAARDNLRLLETQAGKTEKAANSLGRELANVGKGGLGGAGGIQNVSYQLQDLIVQVNAGTSATQALGQQLPQLLSGFGKWGAVLGVAGAALPAVVLAMSNAGPAAKTLADAMGDLNDRIGDTGKVTRSFDMEKLYEEFNKSSKAVQAATIEQLNFQREFIRTTQLVANKKFGESLSDIGMPGLFSGRKSATEILAKDLGVTLDLALKLQPALNGLRDGTGSVNAVLEQFGTKLLGGNSKAIELAATMSELAKAERDAAAASSAISEAQAKMAKGHVLTKKEADELKKAHAAAAKEVEALQRLIDGINSKAGEFDTNYVSNVESLLRAYDKGKLSLGEFNDVFARYVAMQPGARKAVEEAEKQQDEYNKRLMTGADALNKQAAALEREVEFYGMTESAIQAVMIARLEEARAIAAINGASEDHLDFLQREIDARKRIAEASSQREALDASRKSAEDAARQWDRAAADIERALTDSLMRAFESGKDFGDAFAKSLQATFKTMLLRVAVQAVVSPVQSAIGSALGVPGGGVGSLVGQAGTSMLGSLAGSGLVSLGGALGTGTAAGGFATGLGTALSSGASFSGTMAAGSALSSTAGGAAAGLGMQVGAVMPYIGAAIAVASALGAFDKQGAPKSMIGGGGRIGPTGVSYDPTGQAHWTSYTSSDRQLASTVLTDELVKAIQKINAGYTGGAFVKGEVNVKGSSSNQSLAQVTGASGQVLYHRFLEAGKGAEDFQRFAASEIPKLQLALMVDAMRQAGGKVKQIADDVIGTAGDLTDTLQQVDAGGAMARLQEAMAAMEQQAKDTAAALLAGISTALSGVEAAVDAEKRRLDAAYEEQRRAYEDQIDAAQESSAAISALAQTLADAAKTVSVVTPATRRTARTAALGGLNAALSAAQSGQSLIPFADQISEAVGVLSQPSEDLYATFDDFASEQGKAAGALAALSKQADAQKSVAQLTLDAIKSAAESAQREHIDAMARLDAQLTEQKRMVDGLFGVDNSVKSVAAAIAALQGAATLAQGAGAVKPGPGGGSGGVNTGNAVASLYEQMAGRAPDAAGLQYWTDLANQSGGVGAIVDHFRNALVSAGETPRFMNGGTHDGGWAMVGENGPELAYLPPSQIFNAGDTRQMLRGDSAGEIAALRDEQRRQAAAMASTMARLTRVVERWDGDGIPETRAV